MTTQKGYYSRGYLPHLDVASRAQFITWKLADAVPMNIIESWKVELRNLPNSEQKLKLASRVEQYCDQGQGDCILRNPIAARIVQERLIQSHRSMYDLHGWVVMPNHVHALLTPGDGQSLPDLVKRIKGSTSRRINQLLGQSGPLWQEDYFDRMIRDSDHFARVSKYMEWNPVKANLCSDPRLWPWSSASENAKARIETFGKSPAI